MDRQSSFPGAPFYYDNQFNPQSSAPGYGMHQMNPYPAYHGADMHFYRQTPMQQQNRTEQQQQNRPDSPSSSASSQNEASLLAESSRAASGSKQKRREYDTWTQQQQKLLVELWAENHEWVESKEARKAWRKICDELNTRLSDTTKTVEKCTKKMKYLIEKYKTANEWNRKQSGGSRKKSIFYDEIDAVLGCRDIVTLTHVSEAGSSASSSAALNTSSSSSASADGRDDDNTSRRSEAINIEEAKKGQRKERKKARKRPYTCDDEDENDDYSESLKCFKETGEKLGNFMDNFSQMQQQQMTMMGQFLGAMTQFMAKNSDTSSPPK